MESAFFHRLSGILWKAIVSIIVVLAIYVSFGRVLMSNIGIFGDDILHELNARSPFIIEASEVTGRWYSFTPEIVLTDLRLSVEGSQDLPLELVEGRVAIDVWESLKSFSLQTFRISLDQLTLRGQLTEEGKLLFAGMGGSGGAFPRALEKFLLNLEQVQLTNNQFLLELPDGLQRHFDLNLDLSREGSVRRAEVNLVSSSTGTEILVLARGVGNPMDTDEFSGKFYLDVVNGDLKALQDVLPAGPGVNLTGNLSLQAWLGWDRGEFTLETEITTRSLAIESLEQAWKVPLDYMSTKARLKKTNDRWTLFASDFEVHKSEQTLKLPRLQIDLRGDSLRMRSRDIALGPISRMFLELETTPAVMREVFETLDMEGKLPFLQLEIADFHDPMVDWELEGNFRDLDVQSWHGAPGIQAESGFLEFAQDGGSVMIDSHQFSMTYPTVYREPLRFDDFYGTVYIDWTDTDIILSSSVFTAQGIEGTAIAVFGLNIPLQRNAVGLEMDLLVGLQDSYPIHRTKYMPYILNDSLLNWLKGSIGEGKIEEGAFLWRGSLRKNASDLRTVQLFFNVADTNLNYYAGWPSLSDLDGTVLIDDTQVSVWSESARLYDSKIDFLSAEAWMNEDRQMVLAISSTMKGDAADGIQVINQSPLNKIVGEAFTDWRLSGELQTALELQLNLTDSSIPPVVKVETQWSAVDLGINPGNLLVEEVTGRLDYSSQTGFRSQDLVGEIWGQPLEAVVNQRHRASDTAQARAVDYDAATSTTEVVISSRVDVSNVRKWLNLDMLAFAEGETPIHLQIDVEPGQAPGVKIESDLEGVSLDLPEPWGKEEDSLRRFAVALPLAGKSQQISLQLEELNMQVLMSENRFEGLSLGFQYAPEPPVPGLLHVSGHAPFLDEAQWQGFLDTYVYAPSATFAAPSEIDIIDAEVMAEVETAPLKVVIDNVLADTLILYGQDLRDVVFSMTSEGDETYLAGETDWFRGKLWLQTTESPARLEVEYLDLAGLDFLSFDSIDGEALDVPDMDIDVNVMELAQEGRTLGQLAFDVQRRDATLRVDNIAGSLAGLQLVEVPSAALVWTQNGASARTELNAQLEFVNLGETLEQLTYQSVIETNAGQIDLALDWPGGPQDFSLEALRGTLGLNTLGGRFLDTPTGASGTLRVVGILNLADIMQSLSLDLSDMFESGIPFHSIESEVFFHGGRIEVAKMDVKGRSSGFQFSGVSHVAEQSLEGELIATLPVASNLPWVAALAVGLPVAAGVFVVSKVFEKQFNRFSSAVYDVGGTWQDPQVDFDRIFDTSSARKVILTPEQPVLAEGPDDLSGSPIEPVQLQIEENLQPPESEGAAETQNPPPEAGTAPGNS